MANNKKLIKELHELCNSIGKILNEHNLKNKYILPAGKMGVDTIVQQYDDGVLLVQTQGGAGRESIFLTKEQIEKLTQ